ncbi:heavy metal translocating P-type ATPase [Chrysiogenes arsenatis]|uniref:heavy metal translocating P-type ATPase n=1 Tax=Chrysiogenes arsenatis TaxID=309797 RepID=UPI000A05A882|nr:cation-translocating P-type ATPase [Chrysiogenes arsenatis]
MSHAHHHHDHHHTIQLHINNLHCASCADAIARAIRQLTEVEKFQLDLLEKTAHLSADCDNSDELLAKINRIADSIEPGVYFHQVPSDLAPSTQATSWWRALPPSLWCMIFLYIALWIMGHSPYWPDSPLGEGALAIGFGSLALWAGFPVYTQATKNILRREWQTIFDENFLMSLATLAAAALGAWEEAAGVMVFFAIGSHLEERALESSRGNIQALRSLRPAVAHRKREDQWEDVPPEALLPGDTIIVRPGETIPVDGTLLDQRAELDCRAITGESLPVQHYQGEMLLAGSVVTGSPAHIVAVANYGDSTLGKIIELISSARRNQAPLEKFITRFARWYTPTVVIAAALLAGIPGLGDTLGWWHTGRLWSDHIYSALIFLVISCPCALVLSVPLTYFVGLGNSARQGILVKGAAFLDTLSRATTIIFDKTGTLTQGEFSIVQWECADGWEEALLKQYAVSLECHSNHPLAEPFRALGITPLVPSQLEEIPGVGMRGVIDGHDVWLGGERLKSTHPDLSFPKVADENQLALYCIVDGHYAGRCLLADTVRPDAESALQQLKALGLKCVMASGDTPERATRIAHAIGIERAHGGLLPHDKVNLLREEQQNGKTVIAVGDGINDAPLLAASHVGIAMGRRGADVTLEAADIVLLGESLERLPRMIRIARSTISIARQNVALALGLKLAIMGLGVLGLASLWQAVLADVGVALLAIANSMRAGKTR